MLARALRALVHGLSRYDETSDDDNYQPGLGALPRGGVREYGLAYPGVTSGGPEEVSCHDRYGAPTRPIPAPLPRQEKFGVPQQTVVDWGPARPYPQVRLAQMQDLQGDESVMLDMFSDQVDELSRFYHWDEQETGRQARAHLRGTALAYIRHAPFPSRTSCGEPISG